MNLAAVASLPQQPLTGTWFRAIQPHHWATALFASSVPSRFNPGSQPAGPPFELLYLAENPQVALFEVEALLGSPTRPGGLIANPASAETMLNVAVILQNVVDLTRLDAQNRLATSVQELTGDWRGYETRSPSTSVTEPFGVAAPTQELGAALFGLADLEGFLAVSARLPYSKNLVVFPQKLRPGSSLAFTYPATGERYALP